MSILGHPVLRREDPRFLTVGGTYVDGPRPARLRHRHLRALPRRPRPPARHRHRGRGRRAGRAGRADRRRPRRPARLPPRHARSSPRPCCGRSWPAAPSASWASRWRWSWPRRRRRASTRPSWSRSTTSRSPPSSTRRPRCAASCCCSPRRARTWCCGPAPKAPPTSPAARSSCASGWSTSASPAARSRAGPGSPTGPTRGASSTTLPARVRTRPEPCWPRSTDWTSRRSEWSYPTWAAASAPRPVPTRRRRCWASWHGGWADRCAGWRPGPRTCWRSHTGGARCTT